MKAILDIVLYVKMRPIHGSAWVLIDGIVTLLLGLLIYMQWPSSSLWAIGTLVGISMIFSGVARVMMSLAVHEAAEGCIEVGGLVKAPLLARKREKWAPQVKVKGSGQSLP